MSRKNFPLWDECYRKAGPTHRQAASSCARWLIVAQALELSPQHASVGYVGCIGGWKDLVVVGSVRPDICDVVECFEEHARAFPLNPKECGECEHFESYESISGAGLEELASKLVRTLFSTHAVLMAQLTSKLLASGRLQFEDMDAMRSAVKSLCIENLLAALPRRDS